MLLKPTAIASELRSIQKDFNTTASNCKQLEISNVCVPHNAICAEIQVAIDEDNNSLD